MPCLLFAQSCPSLDLSGVSVVAHGEFKLIAHSKRYAVQTLKSSLLKTFSLPPLVLEGTLCELQAYPDLFRLLTCNPRS